MASNAKRYTKYDDLTIVKMRNMKISWRDISKKLGRSINSLKHRLYNQIGEKDMAYTKVYNPSEDIIILNMVDKGYDYDEIARCTGRDPAALKRRVSLLKRIAAREKDERKKGPPRIYSKQGEMFKIDQREKKWLIAMKGHTYDDIVFKTKPAVFDTALPWN